MCAGFGEMQLEIATPGRAPGAETLQSAVRYAVGLIAQRRFQERFEQWCCPAPDECVGDNWGSGVSGNAGHGIAFEGVVVAFDKAWHFNRLTGAPYQGREDYRRHMMDAAWRASNLPQHDSGRRRRATAFGGWRHGETKAIDQFFDIGLANLRSAVEQRRIQRARKSNQRTPPVVLGPAFFASLKALWWGFGIEILAIGSVLALIRNRHGGNHFAGRSNHPALARWIIETRIFGAGGA